jgi:hypothetical protein
MLLTPAADHKGQGLRKSRTGLGYCTQDIPADRIRRVLSFAELATTPAA